MSCDNGFCGTSTFLIFFGVLYFFMLEMNMPSYYESNPLETQDPSEKYTYFNNNKTASEECNEFKEDILIKDKTLSGMFPNPNTIIGIAKTIQWITLIMCIYFFFMLSVRELKKTSHKNLLYFEIGVGILLSFFWIILVFFKKNELENFQEFLSCENVNRDKIRTIPDINDLYDIIFSVIFYIFYLALYFTTIYCRNKVFNNDYDYKLI